MTALWSIPARTSPALLRTVHKQRQYSVKLLMMLAHDVMKKILCLPQKISKKMKQKKKKKHYRP